MQAKKREWQAAKPKKSVMQWLLDSDPSIRWQVMRDLGEQLKDGGWNCEAERGSVRSSFHTTICVLEGLLGLADAWGEFLDWIAANGHMAAPDLYQCYVAGPESSPDPANWRTEFTKPLTIEAEQSCQRAPHQPMTAHF